MSQELAAQRLQRHESPSRGLATHSPGNDLATAADFNLVNKLLQNPRYEIPERLRRKVVSRIDKALDNESDDVALRAVNTLTQLDRNNIKLVELAMPKKIEHRDIKKMSDEELAKALQDLKDDIAKNRIPIIDA